MSTIDTAAKPKQIAKLSSLKADLKREAEGDWVPSFLYPETDIQYRVRALTFPAYRIARATLDTKHMRKFGAGRPVPQEVMSVDVGRLYAMHIVLEWKGFDVEYSEATALEILTDPAYRNIVRDIEFCAGRLGETEVEYIEEAAKNSEPRSSGS